MEARIKSISKDLAEAKKSAVEGAKGKDDFSVVSSVQTIQDLGWGWASGLAGMPPSPTKKDATPQKDRKGAGSGHATTEKQQQDTPSNWLAGFGGTQP